MPSASRINVVSRSSLIDCVFVSVISNLRTFTGHLMKILLNVAGTRYSIIDFRINRPLSLFKGKFNWWGEIRILFKIDYRRRNNTNVRKYESF